MRMIKILGALASLAAIGIAILLAALWVDHKRATNLPTPTGSFAVGRTTCVWTDPSQPELLAPQPGTKRELFGWIWYPAAPRQPNQKYADYLPASWRTALARRSGVLLTQFLTRDLARVGTHSIPDAEISPRQRSYPVILMRAGLSALTTDYTALAEDLASHGYVVVGFDAPYRSFVVVLPDGRVIARAPKNNADLVSGPQKEQLATNLVQAWSSDMGFALDQMERLNASDPSGRFQGRLDLQKVAVFGHSLGGAEALQFCHNDPRCKAGIDLDGAPWGSVVTEGVTQPFLFLMSDHGNENDPEGAVIKANFHSLFERMRPDDKLEIVIRGANHFGFSDNGAMLRSPLLMRVLRAFGVVHLNGRRQIAVAVHYIDTFFDVYLKGAPSSELKRQPEYPEVEYVL
jgi:predicted dienelactone hydrolase